MEISVQQGDITQAPCDVLIVNTFESVNLPGGAKGSVDRALGWITESIAREDFKGKANTLLEVPTFGNILAQRVLLVGLGKTAKFSLEQIRQAAAVGIKRAKALKARTVVSVVHGTGIAGLPVAQCAQALTEGTVLGAYDFNKYKSPSKEEPKVELEHFLVMECDEERLPEIEAGMRKGRIIAEATNMARDLSNEPPEVVTPAFLAQTAVLMAEEFGLACEVWDELRIAEERMNCLHMVGRGSANPPRFIRLDYQPAAEPTRRVCLIGKGLCYDSGGLSLKPAEFMRHMKTDMGGGAAVMAAMRAIAQLAPGAAVTALVPTCENMPGGASYKVDDILRARNGKTIEVDNTDAEGRLVLADALSYAAEQKFDAIIDVATLTGGCIVALGHVWTGVMGTDQSLIDKIIAAGASVGEKMWMLPFDDEVRELLNSDIADIKNAGSREASSIQGGIFLKEFAGEQPWVHLDIAGTSFLEKARSYEPKASTGVPVRTLVAFVLEG